MESSTSARSNGIGWQSASPDQLRLSLTHCKTLIGSNEGSCSHGQWCEGQQCNGKRKCVTRGQCLGLGNWAAMSRRKHASAKRCSKMDQRSEEQECGGRSKCDGISDRWPEVERSLTAQLQHLVMTSRDIEVNTVEQRVASWHSVADAYARL